MKWIGWITLAALASCAPVGEPPPSSPPAPAPAPAPPAGTMDPALAIAANLAASPDHRTLVAAIRAAGLEPVLASAGAHTLFAPTDAAFAKLPSGTIDALMAPTSRPELARLLNHHLVAGRHEATAASLRSAQGGMLALGDRAVTDGSGNRATVLRSEPQANGIVHVIDTVLIPAR